MNNALVRFLPLAALNQLYYDTFVPEISLLFSQDSLILGDAVLTFERSFSAYCDAKHGIGVANGLDALRLCLLACGVGPGDEVILPSNTFIATFLAVSAVGATPIPVEPNDDTFCLDDRHLASAMSSRTKAIIPVHLYGRLADMSGICEFAKAHNLFVIEDAAQAHGASNASGRAGNLGHIAAFSFYPGKNLGGIGDGGFVTTNDDQLARTVRLLRNYGSPQKYVHDDKLGVNSRLDTIQAAFLEIKLRDLDRCNRSRQALALHYTANINNELITTPSIPADLNSHVWHLYVIRCQQRDALQQFLASSGVETLIHYPIPPHKQTAYSELAGLQLPISEAMHSSVLSLPIYPDLPPNHRDKIIRAVNAWRP